jgi:glycosyltransferase involved in cell wall biosynthesis
MTDYLYDLSKRDCCISIARKQSNQGITAALNFGLQHCQGDLIARMDADDIASPCLLSCHDRYFTQHPDRHICGVQICLFNEGTHWFSSHPESVTRSRELAIPGHWFVNHPGIAYRKAAIQKVRQLNSAL